MLWSKTKRGGNWGLERSSNLTRLSDKHSFLIWSKWSPKVLPPRKSKNINVCFWGTSLVVQWLRLHAPNTGFQGSISGQRTRCRMSQLRVHMPQRKILHAATKTQYISIFKNKKLTKNYLFILSNKYYLFINKIKIKLKDKLLFLFCSLQKFSTFSRNRSSLLYAFLCCTKL